MEQTGNGLKRIETERKQYGTEWEWIETEWKSLWKRNGNGMERTGNGLKRNGNGMKRTGNGLKRIGKGMGWNGNAMGTQWERNGNGMGTEWERNGNGFFDDNNLKIQQGLASLPDASCKMQVFEVSCTFGVLRRTPCCIRHNINCRGESCLWEESPVTKRRYQTLSDIAQQILILRVSF